jgi:acetylornithine deacetylase
MSSNTWSKLSQAISGRKNEVVRLTQEMVRRPSFEKEADVQAFITQWWRERGLEPDIWEPDIEELKKSPGFVKVDYNYQGRPNQVILLKGTGGGHSLTLNGHVDVVPVEPVPWKYGGPWTPELKDGKIYGRGSMDMKAGIAVAMIVMDGLRECGIRLKGDLQLQCVVDEENGGNGTLAAILRGYRSDATIFLESTGVDNVLVSSRGAQFFRITVPGLESGIEYQFTLPNVIEKAFILFESVKAYALMRASEANHPLYEWDPTRIPSAICKISAGTWPSTFAAFCVMEGSIECLPGEDIEEVKDRFRAYLLQVADRDPWMHEHPPVIEYFGLRYEAGETSLESPFIRQFSSSYEEVLGKPPMYLGGGGSDLRLPVLYAKSPSVLFGALGGSIHSTDEYVDIESMMKVAQVLGNFILDWCETTD